jgi:hypothetical protein
MEYKTIWSPFSVGICSLKIPTQVIAINSIIYPLKLLSKSWICHYHAYRMHNMTICKQFDAVRHIIINSVSAFTGCSTMKTQGIPFTSIMHPQKLLSVVNICQLCSYRMWNMTIRKHFDGVQDSFESILCSESADLKTGCKELLLMISYTPKSHYHYNQ